MKNCLLVIDMQNDFITGALGTKEAVEIIPAVKARIEKAIKDDEDVIWTKDTHEKDYMKTREGRYLPVEHCIQGTRGYEICDELLPYVDKAKKVIIKNTFGSKELPKYIEEYDNITIIGLCTDICVISNAMVVHAFYPEKNIIIEKKCCAGSTVENHENALKSMSVCQFDII